MHKGYCKNESECDFYHPEKICKNFLLEQKCSYIWAAVKGTLFLANSGWEISEDVRGDLCKYLQREEENTENTLNVGKFITKRTTKS